MYNAKHKLYIFFWFNEVGQSMGECHCPHTKDKIATLTILSQNGIQSDFYTNLTPGKK